MLELGQVDRVLVVVGAVLLAVSVVIVLWILWQGR
jgi:hypothetical protein